MLGTRQIKKALIFSLSLLFATPVLALALERDTASHKFNWGDDLSQTDDIQSPSGTAAQNQIPPTQLKPSHFTDLKLAIDLASLACGVASNAWALTDSTAVGEIGKAGTAIKNTHLNNLRRAIEALYAANGNPNIANYFTGSVNPGDPIQKSDINNMRRALDDLVVGCAVPPASFCWNTIGSSLVGWSGYPAGACANGMTAPGPAVSGGAPCATQNTCSSRADTVQLSGECEMGSVGFCNGPVDMVVTEYFQCAPCAAGSPVCGNGISEAGEQCDNATYNGVCPATCSASCSINACSTCAPVWTCDWSDGSGMDSFHCGWVTPTTCAPTAVCGNGICESGENCSTCLGDCPTTILNGTCVNGAWQCTTGALVDISGSPGCASAGVCSLCIDPSCPGCDGGVVASGPGCWVAAEIFGGWYEPRTIAVRHYINEKAPAWLRKLYLENGRQFAEFIKDKPWIKTIIRPLFEYFARQYGYRA